MKSGNGSKETDKRFLEKGFRINSVFGKTTKKKLKLEPITTTSDEFRIKNKPSNGLPIEEIKSGDVKLNTIEMENGEIRNNNSELFEPNGFEQIKKPKENLETNGDASSELTEVAEPSNGVQLNSISPNGNENIPKHTNGNNGIKITDEQSNVLDIVGAKSDEIEIVEIFDETIDDAIKKTSFKSKEEEEVKTVPISSEVVSTNGFSSNVDESILVETSDEVEVSEEAIELNNSDIEQEMLEKFENDAAEDITVVDNLTEELVSAEVTPEFDESEFLNLKDLCSLNSPQKFINKLHTKSGSAKKLADLLEYEVDIEKLQIELCKLQRWAQKKNKRIAIVFEGRDAAGKSGTIRKFIEHLNPRGIRVAALPKPTKEEKEQWYFERYLKEMPKKGEIVLFDRSWYNRAIVEPANGFCNGKQYGQFMRQVNEFENMLYEDGVQIIKLWFSISKNKQQKRFKARKKHPLKQWKMSSINTKSQKLWDDYTHYKRLMFSKTHTTFRPWIVVNSANKKNARLESIRYVLSQFDYKGRDSANISLIPNPNIVSHSHELATKLD